MAGVIGSHLGRMCVEATRMDVISHNIANAGDTKRVDGSSFKRSNVTVDLFTRVKKMTNRESGTGQSRCRNFVRIEEDLSPGRLRWDPTHPDAMKDGQYAGYVEESNVSVVNEMVDLIAASRAYDSSAKFLGSMNIYLNRASVNSK
ncbi:flagellar basal body rod protein FlgC [Spirochaetales bacterium BR193]|uniref:Flagellar basal body rod protein FlgC n=2 Tax=Entomospira entomophila TaxID=2719988 RepID=A0A968G912_9SPIO|nr:flagellar basal body rod protein FlgC [Entomospira entomophilus]